MECLATRTNIILSAVIATTYLLTSRIALAEDAAVASKTFSVEVKPLTTAIMVLPGSAGLGLASEYFLSENLAAFASLDTVRLHIGDQTFSKMQAQKNADSTMVKDANSTAFGIGLRYYSNVLTDSWYAGGALGYGIDSTRWVNANDQYDANDQVLSTKFEGGYRWQFPSGFLVRVGGGLKFSDVVSRNLGPVAAAAKSGNVATIPDDIEHKAPAHRLVASPSLDFGLGWTF